jgi:hypothetical protein
MTTHPNLDHLRQDVAELFAKYETARARLNDQRRGVPAAANPNGSGSSSTSSTVERALGLDHDTTPELTPDTAGDTLRQLDTTITRITTEIRRAHRIVTAYAPHQPSQKLRDTVTIANDHTCEHCTRWVKPGNVELVHRTGNAAGNLTDTDGNPRTMALGRWCYDFVRANGRLPSKIEVERHDNGLKVRVIAP